jgi:uncharacterized protein YggU (UPF0235/DUF167 family)
MILTVHAKPNSHETKGVAWLDGSTIVIALRASPDDGKANQELIEFLSDKLNIPKTFINLKSGHTSRVKKIELPDGTVLTNLPTEKIIED